MDSPNVVQARAIYETLRDARRQMTDGEFRLFLALEEVFDLKLMRQRERLERLDQKNEARHRTSPVLSA